MVASAPAWLGKAAVLAALGAAFVLLAPRGAAAECTCRYGGQSYALASCVCIATPEGPRMACCDKVLNNSSWTFSREICPIAGRGDAPVTTAELAALHPPAKVATARPRPPE